MPALAAWAPSMAGLWLAAAASAVALLAATGLSVDAAETAAPPDLAPVERAAGRSRPNRVLIVGAGLVGQTVASRLEAQGVTIVGFIDDGVVRPLEGSWQVLGDRDSVADVVCRYDIDDVILAYAPTWQERLVEDLMVRHPGVNIGLVPSFYEALMRTPRVATYDDVVVVGLTEPNGRVWDGLKRLADLAGALVLGVVTAPVMLVLAALIKRTSPGPVIYSQTRVGRGGEHFRLHKFRTMVQGAEDGCGPVLSSGREDPRLTSVGRLLRRTRLDELPQLWNVLRGEMSLVGPRPERPEFVADYQRLTPMYNLRHETRPGITGLAQVLSGYWTDPRDKLRFDLIYVAHRSLWLDAKVVWMTVGVMLGSEGS